MKPVPVRMVLVEDDRGVREGWRNILDGIPGLECVGTWGSAEEALSQGAEARPDVVLMDLCLPNLSGIECIRRWREAGLPGRILVLTVQEDLERIYEALAAGADGYLLKRTTPDQLRDAVLDVMNGGAPMTSAIARRLVESFRQPAPKGRPDLHLSRREAEILDLLCRGYANKEIAAELSISLDTVRTHLKKVYDKLHVRSRTEAMARYLSLRDTVRRWFGPPNHPSVR